MSKGIIKWFNNEKGYGFINGSVDEDIFVHYTAIKQDGYRTLSEGQTVEFNLIAAHWIYELFHFFAVFYKFDIINKRRWYFEIYNQKSKNW